MRRIVRSPARMNAVVGTIIACAGVRSGQSQGLDPMAGDSRYDAVLVQFHEGVPEEAWHEACAWVGGTIDRSYPSVPGLCRVRTIADANIAGWWLSALPFVEFIEPDFRLYPATTPNDPNFDVQWGAENTGQRILGVDGRSGSDMDLTDAWDIARGRQSFVIAVIDSGAFISHEDLEDNLWRNDAEIPSNGLDDDGNGYVDDYNGYDIARNDPLPNDETGHGTSVAGIIGARGNNGRGVAGANWKCQLMILKIFDSSGGFVSDAIEAIEYAVDNGARLSNNSWGSNSNSLSLRNAINAAASSDHLVIAAAGNDSSDSDDVPFYPGSYNLANIISVAATTNRDDLADYSNFGAVSVDLGAPGSGIYTTRRSGGYYMFGGTSAASPNVAGITALLWSTRQGWTFSQVRDRILETVRPIAALQGKTATGGVINAYDALKDDATKPSRPGQPVIESVMDGIVEISWSDNSLNEDRFIIQRQKRNSAGEWVRTRTVARTDHNVSTCEDSPGSGLIRYRVRAKNAAGNSRWSRWRKVNVD